MLARMSESQDTRLWHPFADMGAVRSKELVIDRGEDVWVWDSEGRRYLDATASLWYCNVGHGRPEIAEAVAAQLGRLEAYSAFGDFSNEPARELAARLASLAPMRDARVFLGSGGGDGVDTAAKLARRYWQETGAPERDVLVVRTNAYHGTHGYGTALAGIPANRTSWGPLVPDVSVVPHDSVDALREEVERVGAERIAAVFVEPDMVVFAKGVTSGYLPLGGVVVSGRVAEPFFAQPGAPVFRHGAGEE